MRFDKAFFKAAYGTSGGLPESEYPEIVFSGRSNVGKSSLINRLLNRKALAKVSSTPGKTATINFYDIENAYLVDLPGYGYAKVSKSEQTRWAELMDGYFKQPRDIRLVVQLVDIRHSPTKLDIQMLEFLSDMGLPFIIALTKADKLKKSELEKRLNALPSELDMFDEMPYMIVTSSEKGTGMDELRSVIKEFAEDEDDEENEENTVIEE